MRLVPALAQRKGSWTIGPVFGRPGLLSADGDLLAVGLLLDLKVTLGEKRANGARVDSLPKRSLHQLLGYAILDIDDDRVFLEEVGIFSARFGHLATWPLKDFLAEASGGTLDLVSARRAFEELLRKEARAEEKAIWPFG